MKIVFKETIILFMMIISFLNSCSPFEREAKEYKPNSEEAKKVIEWIIGHDFTFDESISNSYVYKNRTGLDPFYYVKFTINEIEFSKVFDSTWSFSESSSKFLIPSEIPPNRRHSFNIPNWYNPTIDSTSFFFIKEFPGGSKSGMYSRKEEMCFIYYSTY
jgi:hypothetical protein